MSSLAEEMSRLLPRLRRFAYGLSGSVDAADDLVQEACERALRVPEKWSQPSYFERWMFRTIRNLHIDQLRSRKVAERHRTREELRATEIGSDDSGYEVSLTLESLRDVMTRLPEEQRTVLMMVCVEGYTYREVAETLELPIGTITSRLARGRSRVLELMRMDAGSLDSDTRVT